MDHECNEKLYFRDITVQGVTKVVHSMKFVEERINLIIELLRRETIENLSANMLAEEKTEEKTSRRHANSGGGHFSRLYLRLIRLVLQNGGPIRNTARNVSPNILRPLRFQVFE